MRHEKGFLDNLWHALVGGDAKIIADVKFTMGATNPDIPPEIVCNNAIVQVLSVPVDDNTARVVYARTPGASWLQLP